jgi:hypothetical protein
VRGGGEKEEKSDILYPKRAAFQALFSLPVLWTGVYTWHLCLLWLRKAATMVATIIDLIAMLNQGFHPV